MDKALKMGKDLTKGSFHLFVAKIISYVLLAVTAIAIGFFVEDVAYGLYVISLVPITTFLLIQELGVGAALTKYCALYRTDKDNTTLRKIILAGMTFVIVTGLILTLLSIFMSGFIASTILGQSELSFLIILGSISILFTGINVASQAIFVGFERMDFTGIVVISQAAGYFVLSPLLVYLGYGALGLMLGYTFSIGVAGLISIVLLYFFIFRKLTPYKQTSSEISKTLKMLLRYGIPLAIAGVFSGLFTQFSSFMMAYYCEVALIGHYKIALNFAIFMTFLTGPIGTVLFPAFSKLDSVNERGLLKSVYSYSIKYTSLFSLPVTVAMIVLSSSIIGTLYGERWGFSPLFLSLYVIQYLFIALGGSTYGTFLRGLGETKILMKLALLTLIIGIPIAFVLIPPFEIVGLIFTILFASLPSLLLGIYWIWKHYQITVDFTSSAKILIASTIAGLITFLLINAFVAADWIKLITGAVLFFAIYLISSPLVGSINQVDINNLRVMFSGLGILSRLLEIPFRFIEKLLKNNEKLSKLSEQN